MKHNKIKIDDFFPHHFVTTLKKLSTAKISS